MAQVTVRKLDGAEETELFAPAKGSGILTLLKEDYGTGKLLNSLQQRITPEQNVDVGKYTYLVTAVAVAPAQAAAGRPGVGEVTLTRHLASHAGEIRVEVQQAVEQATKHLEEEIKFTRQQLLEGAVPSRKQAFVRLGSSLRFGLVCSGLNYAVQVGSN